MKCDELPSLLLLPPPPVPAGRERLAAACRPSLEGAISRASNPDKATVLIVALACPLLTGRLQRFKALDWAQAQSLVAGVYSIASSICARLSIQAHIGAGPGSVDVRVVLVDRDTHRFGVNGAGAAFPTTGELGRPAIEANNTAVVDLPTFAAAYFPWDVIFHCSTEAGFRLFADYLRLAEGRQVLRQDQLVAVDGGLTMNVVAPHLSTNPPPPPHSELTGEGGRQAKGHHIVCIGGTFDHLHAGHKLLLTGGALLLEIPGTGDECPTPEPCRFIVGVTGDELLRNKKHADLVQPWDQRARCVIDFLSTLLELRPTGWSPRAERDEKDAISRTDIVEADGDFRAILRDGAVSVECVRIQDAFGPTITIPEVSSLVVSAETRSGGQAVNSKRAELGWPPLQIYEVDVLDAGHGDEHACEGPTMTTGFASKISSTAIRKTLAESGA